MAVRARGAFQEGLHSAGQGSRDQDELSFMLSFSRELNESLLIWGHLGEEPVLDGEALVGVTIGGNDRITKFRLCYWAPEESAQFDTMSIVYERT